MGCLRIHDVGGHLHEGIRSFYKKCAPVWVTGKLSDFWCWCWCGCEIGVCDVTMATWMVV